MVCHAICRPPCPRSIPKPSGCTTHSPRLSHPFGSVGGAEFQILRCSLRRDIQWKQITVLVHLALFLRRLSAATCSGSASICRLGVSGLLHLADPLPRSVSMARWKGGSATHDGSLQWFPFFQCRDVVPLGTALESARRFLESHDLSFVALCIRRLSSSRPSACQTTSLALCLRSSCQPRKRMASPPLSGIHPLHLHCLSVPFLIREGRCLPEEAILN